MNSYVLIRLGPDPESTLANEAAALEVIAGYDVRAEHTGDRKMVILAREGELGISSSARAAFTALWHANLLSPIDWPGEIPLRYTNSDDPIWDGLIGTMS